MVFKGWKNAGYNWRAGWVGMAELNRTVYKTGSIALDTDFQVLRSPGGFSR